MARTVAHPQPRRAAAGRSIAGRNPAGRAGVVYSGVATNTGAVATPPTIEVAGPSPASFFLRNATAGRTVWVSYAVPSGQTLVVDFAARTATISGSPVAAIAGAQEWWDLAPGANTIESSAPAVTVKFSPAFL